jgi:hypothetical protein
MTRNTFAAAFAAMVLAGFQFTNSGAAGAMLGSSTDDTPAISFADAATQAGTAAGIVNQCHSDAAPIHSAFMRALDSAKFDSAHRQSLWQRYRTAETTTLSALAGAGAISCADTNGIIQKTIHELGKPLS